MGRVASSERGGGCSSEQILELTGGVGAEVVIDFVGEGGATSAGTPDTAPVTA